LVFGHSVLAHSIFERQKLVGNTELGVDVGRRHKSEVSYFGKALGQYMKQKASNEFDGLEGFRLSILGAEANAVVIVGNEAMIGDANTVGVATQVVEDIVNGTEWSLGIDNPLVAKEPIAKPSKGIGISQIGAGSFEAQFAQLTGTSECIDKFGTENSGNSMYRKEESCLSFALDPPGVIGTESAVCYDAVQVWVEHETSGPCVKHGGNAKLATEPLGI